MSLAEIDKEFRRIRDLIESGSKSLEARSYEDAQNSLFQALKQIDALKLPASAEKVECLEKLADAYYQQKKYIEARSVYQQLRATVDEYSSVDGESKARILFKLARSTDQVQDYEGAAKIFDDAVIEAESCMETGTPFLTELYEANANVLRRARLDPDKLVLLERKVRVSRQKQSGIQESLFDPIDEEKKRKRLAEAEAYYQSLSRVQKLIHLARTHPWKSLGVIFSPVIIATTLLIVVATFAFFGIDLLSTQLLSKGDLFVTPDHAIEIAVDSPTRARVKTTNASEVQVRSLNRWSELVNTLRPMKGTYWVTRRGDKLIGEDNITYYGKDSSYLRIGSVMTALGKAIHKRVTEGQDLVYDVRHYKAYGFDRKDFEPDMHFYIGPYQTDTEDLGNSVRGELFKMSVMDFVRNVEQTKHEGELAKLFAPEKGLYSGELPIHIKTYHHKDAIAIIARDANRNSMRTTDGSKFVVCSTTNIKLVPPAMNAVSANFIPDIVGRKVLLVSDRNQEQVKKKYFHLFMSIMLLIFLFIMGFVLVQQMQRESARFEYYSQGTQKVGEALCWLAYGSMCLFYVGYIAWVVFS